MQENLIQIPQKAREGGAKRSAVKFTYIVIFTWPDLYKDTKKF